MHMASCCLFILFMYSPSEQPNDVLNTPTLAAKIPLPIGLQTPNINVQAPTDPDASQPNSGSKQHSRAPSRTHSRVSNIRIESVHETEGDTDTMKDEGDARTVPVETVSLYIHPVFFRGFNYVLLAGSFSGTFSQKQVFSPSIRA